MALFKKPCKHCGELVESDALVCPNCTRHNPLVDRCFNCNREITRNNKVCSGCGRPVYLACPVCKATTFMQDRCDVCGANLMIKCTNKRCGVDQFFNTIKCNACGKKIKK